MKRKLSKKMKRKPLLVEEEENQLLLRVEELQVKRRPLNLVEEVEDQALKIKIIK